MFLVAITVQMCMTWKGVYIQAELAHECRVQLAEPINSALFHLSLADVTPGPDGHSQREVMNILQRALYNVQQTQTDSYRRCPKLQRGS